MINSISNTIGYFSGSSIIPLDTPTNLQTSATSGTQIQSTWGSVSGASSYTLQRALNSDFSFGLSTVYTGSNTTYTDTGLTGGNMYYYRVKATGVGFSDSSWSSYSSNDPGLFGVSIDSMTNLYLNWDFADATKVIIDGSNNLQQITDKGSAAQNGVPANSGVRPPYRSSDSDFNGKGAVEITTGKQLFNTSLSLNSPWTLYFVCKFPTLVPADNTIPFSIGLTGGNNGLQKFTGGTQGPSWRFYTGLTPFYSVETNLALRTEAQVIKVMVRDQDSVLVEVNDEPPVLLFNQDAAGTTLVSILNRISLSLWVGTKWAQCLIFSEGIEYDSTKDVQIKRLLINKFGIKPPSKLIMHFGDSHTQGVMSGTVGAGNYTKRIQENGIAKIINLGRSGTVVDPATTTQGAFRNLSNFYTLYNKTKYSNYFLFLQYGTNDSAVRGTADHPTRSQWVTIYSNYIQSFIDAGFSPTKIVLITPPYSTTAALNSTHLPDIVADTITIASTKGVNLLNWWAEDLADGLDCKNNADQVHANGASHDNIYQLIVNYLSQFS